MAKPNGKEKKGDTGLSMAPPKICEARFEAAIRAMADIGILKETAAPVLNNLLKLFDYNWVHIEADNYLALADAIFYDSDPKEGQKRQANETNLDADQCNKKLKTKQRSQNPTSKMHGNDNREFVEAPPQQGRGTLSARTVNGKKVTRAHLELPSSQLLIKEPHACPSIAEDTTIVQNNSAVLCHGDPQTLEVPMATTCPQVVAPGTRKDARRTSGSHHDQKHERNRAVACSNQEIVSSKDSPSNIEGAFLDSCISMIREPLKHPHFYCKICPNERMKMEVFLTPGKKGWGLRSTEKLPRGAFVCEYVGEILTNIELYDRTIQKTGKAKHTYPLLLDADWGTEGVLKDEEALCLDATFYGNVARFINHRCFDANIIGIPVEIETPDHHYYHLAFFTTRIIKPFEELTWDYGIDFDDVDHPVKAFKCRCGSEFCRDKAHILRSKSRARV
uniref:SET domain-containing protein n=1 Tax=Oryza punctata TaxID=4537 RepID=A0A0E0K2J5_ORYPU